MNAFNKLLNNQDPAVLVNLMEVSWLHILDYLDQCLEFLSRCPVPRTTDLDPDAMDVDDSNAPGIVDDGSNAMEIVDQDG